MYIFYLLINYVHSVQYYACMYACNAGQKRTPEPIIDCYAASLCYIFTVGKSGSGPWQHKVQGQLNEETFLSYNSINNCHVFGVLGIRLNATKICDKQVDTLKDGADLIKQQVIRMNNIIRDNHQRRHCIRSPSFQIVLP
ncbi:NKG2D ligand 1-like protein [Cricetulus griseus]|nr:NKG2D ligand 1-like protein [Cricetulus griseus]